MLLVTIKSFSELILLNYLLVEQLEITKHRKTRKMRRILHLLATALAGSHLSYSITDGTRLGSYIGNIVQDLAEISLTSSTAIFQVVKGANIVNVTPEGDLRVITDIDRENSELCSKDEPRCSISAEILYRNDNDFKLFYIDLDILDINDNSPVFEKDSIEIHLPENTGVGTKVRLPSATDADSKEFGIERYEISDPARFFSILPLQHPNGKIIPQLVLEQPLDFEKRENHELELVAFDFGGLSSSMKVNVVVDDVNDHSPTFGSEEVSMNLTESIPVGTVIHKLNASDGDRGRYGIITYSFDDGLTDALSRKIFEINSKTGDIAVNSELNYEMQKKHVLYVQAFDGSESALSTVTINIVNVNDNAPQIELSFGRRSDAEGRISEDAPVGTFVAFVRVTDSDKDQQLTVALEDGEDGDFELESIEGSNRYILKTAKELDRERVHLYKLTLRAMDNGSPPLTTTNTKSIKVEDVNDNAPFFQRDMYHVNILENNDVGKSIVSLRATDVDEGVNAEIEYFLGEEDSPYFSLERETGNLVALKSLDAEFLSRHVVQIIAVDKGSPSLRGETSVIINVLDENDNDPVFERLEYDFSFPETTEGGTVIGSVSAIDADTNAQVRYRLGSNSVPFRIHPETGKISLQRSIDADIDKTKYNIEIIAEDKDGRSATASVSILVEDINDNAPALIWPNPDLDVIQVTLDTRVAEKVATIQVRDRDQGANGEVIINQIKPRELFRINSAGEVFLASKLKRSDLGANPILISISDGGSPPLQISSRVNIYVTEEEVTMTASDVQALLPEFKSQSLSLKTSTSQLAFFLVAVFTALVFVVFMVTFYIVIRRRSKSSRNSFPPPPPHNPDYTRCNQSIENPHLFHETQTHKKPGRPLQHKPSATTSPRHSRIENYERVKWQVELTSSNHPHTQCTIENSFHSDSGRESASDGTNENPQLQQVPLSSPKSTHSSLTSARPTFSTFMDESDLESVTIVESEREVQKIWPSLEKKTPEKRKPPIHPRSNSINNSSLKK
ncbi:Oidioi.mRNA.OKI2018_I69.chr2.g5952.t1.cds [Oikopleura dioica]|uniref:Oidioi.mRNA.OKI2018_I69.chr2.g5952.t1.cds n=1 Tax=Oikopleura dioica TaxID=34765 RepID=A0ABN7T3P4_OIKDI|nr:Oidioi.mRNA.OKI2018_I69.chr2.g5952.t1.cds [Oikopleura dioica]